MTYDDFEVEIVEAILTGKNKDKIIKKILEEERSLPLELIKLGYNQSFYRYDAQGKLLHETTGARKITNKDPRWIHMLAYCDDKSAVEYIEEILVSEQRHLGNCILALWSKNQKKALHWLNLIHKFDPQFQRLHFIETSFTSKLCSYYSCQKTDLFNILLLREHKQKGEIIHKSIQKALFTKKMFYDMSPEEKRVKQKEMNDAFEERRKLIESGTLSPEQADQLFNALWDGNIDFQEKNSTIIERDPQKVFLCFRPEDSSVNYRFNQEIPQFLELLPQLSSASDEKIISLYTYLPFWLEHYWPIEEVMYKLNPKQVLEDWKKLIITDAEFDKPIRAETGGSSWLEIGKNSRKHKSSSGKGRPRGKTVWSSRPTPEEIIKGLNRLKELADKELLISIMNHYDEHVREEVQKHLKEIV